MHYQDRYSRSHGRSQIFFVDTDQYFENKHPTRGSKPSIDHEQTDIPPHADGKALSDLSLTLRLLVHLLRETSLRGYVSLDTVVGAKHVYEDFETCVRSNGLLEHMQF